MSETKRLVSVAVACPLHRVFDYQSTSEVAIGARVRVNFAGRETLGVVLAQGEEQPDLKYKALLEVVDETALFDDHARALWQFIARYYQAPMGWVMESALPKALRKGKGLPAKLKPLPHIEIKPPPPLSAEQQSALANLARDGFAVDLVEGVTGSGKSELYAARVAEIVAQGKQVLVLVPEIGLIENLAGLLTQRLGTGVVRYHSDLTEAQQMQAWTHLKNGTASVVVGTRSAVFLPFQALGLVVVDEEHDLSYKQQEGEVRYHARDVALWRAKRFDVPALLGSATPSLESYHHAWAGRYRLHQLKTRINDVALPRVQFAPTTREGLSDGLLRAIQSALGRAEQTMLFLNRRGFAPALSCVDCGWQAVCPACDALYAVHTDRLRLRCHHCRREHPIIERCPSCHSRTLQTVGMGTQRLERTLQQYFPHARILRMDSDTLTTPKRFMAAVEAVQQGAVEIILGTQWLSKGHHFPKLSVVGLVDSDGAFFSHDFRALERLAQQLVQVSGRAGRERAGEVWVQTKDPYHPVFSVLNQPYQAYAKALYQERRAAQLPPVGAQALLITKHQDGQRAFDALDMTMRGAQEAGVGADLLWLGPVPAPMLRKDGVQRMQMLLQAENRAALQSALPDIRLWLEAQANALGVRYFMDIDPLTFDE